MRWESSFRLLEAIMSGEELTGADLDAICKSRVPEGQFIDFKDGRWLEGKDAAHGVREYVSGFANGGGGTLLVGIADEGDRASAVTGCKAPGGKDLVAWAKSALVPMWSSLSPLPRILEVKHETRGSVLVISTFRSPSLIPCCRDASGAPAYHYRFNDSTLAAPAYLISDILLGRRQHPELKTETFQAACHDRPPNGLKDLNISLSVHNDGLIWASQVKVGIVGWSIRESSSRPNSRLLSYLEVVQPDRTKVNPELIHMKNTANTSGGEPDIEPFGTRSFVNVGRYLVPELRPRCRWSAAAYVMSRGSPPTWFQLSHESGSDRVAVHPVPEQSARVELACLD